MGWLFSHQTKEDLLRELLASTSTFAGSTEVLAHAVSGNELWTVVNEPFTLLDSISASRPVTRSP